MLSPSIPLSLAKAIIIRSQFPEPQPGDNILDDLENKINSLTYKVYDLTGRVLPAWVETSYPSDYELAGKVKQELEDHLKKVFA